MPARSSTPVPVQPSTRIHDGLWQQFQDRVNALSNQCGLYQHLAVQVADAAERGYRDNPGPCDAAWGAVAVLERFRAELNSLVDLVGDMREQDGVR